MRMLVSLIAVFVLLFLAYLGAELISAPWIFGIVVPYLAAVLFLGGFVRKILDWAKTPVPFRIPTACVAGALDGHVYRRAPAAKALLW